MNEGLNVVIVGKDYGWCEDLVKKLKLEHTVAGDVVLSFEEMKHVDFCLYVLTQESTDFASIARVVDISNKYPAKTVLCTLCVNDTTEFSEEQLECLSEVRAIVESNGGNAFTNLQDVANYLNQFA